jgi:hypothetical protein
VLDFDRCEDIPGDSGGNFAVKGQTSDVDGILVDEDVGNIAQTEMVGEEFDLLASSSDIGTGDKFL